MFYALTHNKIDTRGYEFRHHIQDIESLNRLAQRGELEITAVSCTPMPTSRGNMPSACGASVGSGYGPILVTGAAHPRGARWPDHRGARDAHHGLPDVQLALPRCQHLVVPFDQILMPSPTEGLMPAW